MIAAMPNEARDIEIGARIRALRKAAGLTQHQLVALMREQGTDVSRSSIAQIELGERRCSLSRAFELAKALQVPVQRVIGEDVGDPLQLRALELLEQIPPSHREKVVEVLENLAQLYSTMQDRPGRAGGAGNEGAPGSR